MAKKQDFTQVAYRVFRQAIGESVQAEEKPLSPRATAGKKGGLRGGPARSKALPKKRRQEIARKAAQARWKKVR